MGFSPRQISSYWLAFCLVFSAWNIVHAEDPPKQLTKAEIQRLKFDGDRLADQGDYLAALKKYNTAYMGVVAEIRGQSFLDSVTPSMLSREELGQEMREQIDKEYAAEDLEFMDAAYHALGLMSLEQATKNIVTKLLTEEVAGFYDPDNKRMVLIVEDAPAKKPGWLGRLLGAGETFDKDEQKTTLAHELTHALQDQLYDLNAMEEGIEDDDDLMLAFAALVEGDATLLMFVESGDMDLEDMDPAAMRTTFNLMSWMMPMVGGETYRSAPPIFRDSLLFPYLQGMLFTLAVAGEGDGWETVDATYRSPPISTEQILHPKKYFDNASRDLPQKVTIPDTSDLIPDWKKLGENCLGELQTSIMLKGIQNSRRASEGWDGDKYLVFKDENEKLGLIFVSVWDSNEDAQEFAKAYKAFREQDPQKTKQAFAASSTQRLDVRSDKVFVLEGFDEEVGSKLLEHLHTNCEFSEKEFPLPDKTK